MNEEPLETGFKEAFRELARNVRRDLVIIGLLLVVFAIASVILCP